MERLPRDRDAKQKIQKAIESEAQERSIHTRRLEYNSRFGSRVVEFPKGKVAGA